MNDFLYLATALAAGLALGAFFFGGLRWTVRKGIASTQPALWFLGSSLLRTGIVLVGFYLVSGPHWKRLLLCLLGFVIARIVLTRLTRPSRESTSAPAREGGYAS